MKPIAIQRIARRLEARLGRMVRKSCLSTGARSALAELEAQLHVLREGDRTNHPHDNGFTWDAPSRRWFWLVDGEDLHWLGGRLLVAPLDWSAENLVSVASSRLGDSLAERGEWFTTLRQVAGLTAAQNQTLLVVRGTTTARWLLRLSDQLAVHRCIIQAETAGEEQSWQRWFHQVPLVKSQRCQRVVVSPPLTDFTCQEPERDLLQFALAERLVVVDARRGGTITRLLDRRLNQPRRVTQITHPLVTRRTGNRVHSTSECTPDVMGLPSWPVLAHWTRDHRGPWPEEPKRDFMDGLLLQVGSLHRDVTAVLRKILEERKLRASSRFIRGSHQVVSFSQRSLRDWHHLRTYRRHLRRWDFEPYGVGIHLPWLQEAGARAVRYMSGLAPRSTLWQETFSQPAISGGHDWTMEQEWRIVGDVDLNRIPRKRAFVFVPSLDQARKLADVSPFPFVLMDEVLRCEV